MKTMLQLEVNYEQKTIEFHRVQIFDDEDNLKQYYKYLNCSCIDIQEFELNGEYFDAIFDDEFLLKNKDIVPTLFINENVICGNVLFTRCNKDGVEIGLYLNDFKKIMNWYPKMFNNILMPYVRDLMRNKNK